MIKILKKCVLKVFNFVKKILILENPQIFFFFVLKCKQKEHFHNLNRRRARSALKPRKKGAKRLEFLVFHN